MDICETIDRLTDYAAKRLELDPRDAVYARNTVLAVLGYRYSLHKKTATIIW